MTSTAGTATGLYPLAVYGSYSDLGQAKTRLLPLSVTVQTDLAVTALTGPAQGQAGNWFAITDTIQNQGTSAANGFYVGYYLSTDNEITDADIRIGSRWVANLSPGATSTGGSDVWVPVDFVAGTYYLGALVDDVHQVPDSNPANNGMAANTITIAGAAPNVPMWVSHYRNQNGYGGVGQKIVADAAGNSIVAGSICGRVVDGYCDSDVTIIKYQSDGTTLWTATYDSGASDFVKDMTVDGSGNIYITLQACQAAGYCATYDTITIKYDANGNALWSTPARYPYSVPGALTVDGSGNVYVTGGGCENPYTSTVCYLTTIKYDGDGNKLWDSQEPSLHVFTGGRDIAVDNAGNVYITADEIGYGYATIKYGPNGGAPLWHARYSEANYARALALDAAGNIYVSGTAHSGTSYDIVTVKYDNNGNQLWATRYDNGGDDTLGFWNYAFGQIAVDASGNVYIVGVSANGMNEDYVTIKYDVNGNPLWTSRYDGGWGDIAIDMKTDGVGNVYVTGIGDFLAWSSSVDTNYVTVKYGPDGHPLWFGSYDHGGIEFAYALTLNSSGDFFVTGYSSAAADFLTVKYVIAPDLLITDVSTALTGLPIGGAATVSTTVKNQGSVATSVSSTVGIYLSTDATITTEDILIGSRTVGVLAPGETSTVETSMLLPPYPTLWPNTNYYLGAIADVNNVQPEISDANNALAGMTLPAILDVDLVLTNISSVTTSIPAGGTMTVSSTIKNLGASPDLSSGRVDIYLSSDQTCSVNCFSLGSRDVGALAAGASSTGDTVVTVYSDIPPGTYYLLAYACCNTKGADQNRLVGNTITVTTNTLDLMDAYAYTSATLLPVGGSTTVTNGVRNQGITKATAFSVGIYLSTDATITTADTLVGTRDLRSLDAGAWSQATTTITIPAGLALGTYYLGAFADYTNTQAETIESNNGSNPLWNGTVTVVPNVDLLMTGISSKSTSAKVGSNITVSNTVKNAGTKSTTTSTVVGIYLSTDATITAEDTLIVSRTVASLAAGASSSASTAATIPSGLASGTYYLGAIADKDNAQSEFNEDNNAMKAPKTITITQ
ncbi:MAG: CARDB domain-containing protein [Gallionellaceae bacterium]|nr:CARDB domain-containing protein [Gallionellaceae bacterium]